jgi:multiple sugar transport system substrate-binding protein
MSANLGALSKGNAPAGKSVLQFYTQFADSSKVSYTWNSALPDSQSAFISGDVALYLGFASEARHLRAANPNLDFGVAPIPQRANASIKQGYGLIYAFAIPRGAKNYAGGSAAAVALVGAENGKTAALTTSLAPSRRSLLASLPADPLGAVVYTSALFTKGWLSPTPLDTDQVFSAMINDVISGRLTPEAALTTAENSLNAYSQK